jgi:hypothetical protein
MPVTQRWVHSGLILAVVVFSMCLTILVLGASRTHISDTGLPGSKAAGFQLKDSAEVAVAYDARAETDLVNVLVFVSHASGEIVEYADMINSLVSTYRDTPTVRLTGISYVYDASLTGATPRDVSQLEIHCPMLHTARDFDGSVARAYRVNSPTLVVVDQKGIIRGRMPLSQPSLMMSATELINSLQRVSPTFPTLEYGDPRASR